jgi:hypothetical protein
MARLPAAPGLLEEKELGRRFALVRSLFRKPCSTLPWPR